MKIYHITKRSEWEKAEKLGGYEPESVFEEGFIHASTKQQVIPTAERRYQGQKDLVVLVIDTDKVKPKIVFEDTSGRGEKHPHIYGGLDVKAVVKVMTLTENESGKFEMRS